METPSSVQINEEVHLNFFIIPKIENCIIDSVKFSDGKVRYDVLVPIVKEDSTVKDYTLIKDVDSICIGKILKG